MTVNALYCSAEPDLDRLLRALRFERTNRIPLWEFGIESRSIEYILGKRVRQPLLPPHDQVVLAQRLGMNAIRAWVPSGALGEVSDEATDGSYIHVGGAIKSKADLERYDLDQLRQDWLRQAEALVKESLEAVRGTRLGVVGNMVGPLLKTYVGMGLEDFMLAVHDDPDLVLSLLDFHAEYNRQLARLYAREGLPLVVIVDDLAHTTGLLTSPTLLEEWWYPRLRSTTEILAAAGIPYAFHCCGKLDRVLPFLIRLGCAAVQTIQPNCNDIYAIRRRYGRQIALIGNIDITYPLSLGTPEDVRRDVREHLDRLGPESGYVVCSCHSIQNTIPPENFLAMVQATHEWRPPT